MWQPITRSDFEAVFREQEMELSPEEREVFDQFRVPLQMATICRNELSGTEYGDVNGTATVLSLVNS